MASWHPPIPAGIATSTAIHNLRYKTAVLLLLYCYDGVRRDGRVTVSLTEAASELGEPYETVRRWWRDLRSGPFFCEQIDRGRIGWEVKFSNEWIDWHVLSNNFERSPVNAEQSSIGFSSNFERSPVNADTSGIKVLNNDQESKEIAARKKRAPRTPRENKETVPEIVITTLADVCKIDRAIATKIQRDQLYQSAGILARAGAKRDQAPEQIAETIRYVAGFFRQKDWRGQKGQDPTPAQIREVWTAAIEARNGKPLRPSLNGHSERKPQVEADPERGF